MVLASAHEVENMSVTEAFAVVLVLATRRTGAGGCVAGAAAVA